MKMDIPEVEKPDQKQEALENEVMGYWAEGP
jgi:hypothetical protein